VARPKRARPFLPRLAGGIVLPAAVGIAAFPAGRKAGVPVIPSFRQLTFQRGQIFAARFAPDGQNAIYSGSWEGRPSEIFVARLDSPESRPFGLRGADVLSISPTGELAVALHAHLVGPFARSGMLARIGITGGGTPRESQDDVQSASWLPNGSAFAVIRDVAGRSRVESPIGKVLYETPGWLSDVRVQPGGGLIAFM